jgi:alanine racemase
VKRPSIERARAERAPAADGPRAWVEIDLGAIARNASSVAERAGVPLLPMIKADAYGLGAVPVARALGAVLPWAYGVATIEEGVELRAAKVTDRIVVFTPLLNDELAQARAHGLTPTLGRRESIDAWVRVGGGPWHLAVDTGMHRAGAAWDGLAELADILRRAPPEGAFTHYHSADRNGASIAEQTRRFERALDCMPVRPPILHVENSPAIERLRDRSAWTLVRPGLFLYGVESCQRDRGPDGGRVDSGSGDHALRPEEVVALRARVVEVRTVAVGETVSYGATYRALSARRIATVAAGYADGYRRAFSNVGRAIVNGQRVPVAGIVTMDTTMLDVTGVPCAIGDVATLLGRAHGGAGAPVIELATAALEAGISPYELLTGLHARLPRVYGSSPPE